MVSSDSEDEVSRASTRSLRSQASNGTVPDTGDVIELSEAHCKALFSVTKKGRAKELVFVCLRAGSQCRRHHHSDGSLPKAPNGYFVRTAKSSGGNVDGQWESAQDPDRHAAEVAARKAERRAAMEALGTQSPSDPLWGGVFDAANAKPNPTPQAKTRVHHVHVDTVEEDSSSKSPKSSKTPSPTSVTQTMSGSSTKKAPKSTPPAGATAPPMAAPTPDPLAGISTILGDLVTQMQELKAQQNSSPKGGSSDSSSEDTRAR